MLRYTDDMKGRERMPSIKPISDLRHYSEVLADVSEDAPVFLTKNGRGRYAILDIKAYEKLLATIQLMNELEKGQRSGEKEGWLSEAEVRKRFCKEK